MLEGCIDGHGTQGIQYADSLLFAQDGAGSRAPGDRRDHDTKGLHRYHGGVGMEGESKAPIMRIFERSDACRPVGAEKTVAIRRLTAGLCPFAMARCFAHIAVRTCFTRAVRRELASRK